MTVFTIDVSNHDWARRGGPLDWHAIRAAGIQVACVKVSEGNRGGMYSYTDPRGPAQIAAARAAGIFCGAYHCLSRGGATNQAAWLAEFDADWYMLDVEPFSELTTRGIAPTINDISIFQGVFSKKVATYLPLWYWSQLGSPNLSFLDGALVSSDYGANPKGAPGSVYLSRGGDGGRGFEAYGNRVPELWQFGSQLTVPGCSTATDVNAYRGSIDQFKARFSGQKEGDDMSLTTAQDTALSIAWEVADALRDGQDITESRHDPVWVVAQIKSVSAQAAANGSALSALSSKVDTLLATPPGAVTDEQLERVLRKVLRSVPEV
jgi:Glycosyl hydrolases family 25